MADNYGAPQSRNEAILQNILGEDNELLEPVSRIEVLLTDLLNLLEQEALPSGTNDGDILVWDDTSKKWVATAPTSAGSSDVLNPPVYPTPDVTVTD